MLSYFFFNLAPYSWSSSEGRSPSSVHERIRTCPQPQAPCVEVAAL